MALLQLVGTCDGLAGSIAGAHPARRGGVVVRAGSAGAGSDDQPAQFWGRLGAPLTAMRALRDTAAAQAAARVSSAAAALGLAEKKDVCASFMRGF